MIFDPHTKIGLFLLFIILTMGGIIVQYLHSPACSTTIEIPALITVVNGERKLIGLNGNRDSLQFGTVSPSALAKKTTYFRHTRDASVTVSMEGPLVPWTMINPSTFMLHAGEEKEISFEVAVPEHTPEGEYAGKAIFCVREE